MLEIIGLACVGVLWINAEPTIRLREWLYKKIYGCDRFDDKWHWRLINCAMCISFYIALVGTGSILYASIVSVLAEFISRKLNEGGLY